MESPWYAFSVLFLVGPAQPIITYVHHVSMAIISTINSALKTAPIGSMRTHRIITVMPVHHYVLHALLRWSAQLVRAILIHTKVYAIPHVLLRLLMNTGTNIVEIVCYPIVFFATAKKSVCSAKKTTTFLRMSAFHHVRLGNNLMMLVKVSASSVTREPCTYF